MTLRSGSSLYEQVAVLIVAARSRVRSAVNQEMVLTYWQVGRLIVEDEQAGELRAEYGKAVLDGLAERLTAKFGKGFERQINSFYYERILSSRDVGPVRSEAVVHMRELLPRDLLNWV